MIKDVLFSEETLSYHELLEEYKKLQRRHQKIIKRSDNQTRKLFELNKKLEEMAYLDYMTKLYNRRYFLNTGKKYFKQGHSLALAMIDIDKFKNINDTYGHDVGDKVIINLAGFIKKTISIKDIAARWGGEEFVILFRDKNILQTYQFCENLRKSISSTKVDNEIRYSVSIGISHKNSQISSLEELIKQADIALYKAKESGRNRVEY